MKMVTKNMKEILKMINNGKGKLYYENGKEKYEGIFENDEYNDESGKFYDEEGKVYIGGFKDGKKHGDFMIFKNKNGELIKTTKFENDKEIDIKNNNNNNNIEKEKEKEKENEKEKEKEKEKEETNTNNSEGNMIDLFDDIINAGAKILRPYVQNADFMKVEKCGKCEHSLNDHIDIGLGGGKWKCTKCDESDNICENSIKNIKYLKLNKIK